MERFKISLTMIGILFLVVLFFPSTILFSTTSDTRYQDSKASLSYLEALQTANAFLCAWVNRDAINGLPLISERLRISINDESWLSQFIVGLSNPHHQAFLISQGHNVGTERYVFPVILYELYSGTKISFEYLGTIEVIRQGKNWRIDRLPKSSDNP